MVKIAQIYPRDIIGIIALIACFILMALGINHVVSGLAIMIITYYFSKRVYEEKNPDGNINGKLKELEDEIKQLPKAPIIIDKPAVSSPPNPRMANFDKPEEPSTTGDFKPGTF